MRSVSARRGLAFALGLVFVAACRHDAAAPRGGQLSVRLTGRDETAAPRPGRDSSAAGRVDTGAGRRDTARVPHHDTGPPRARRDTAAMLAFTAGAAAEWCDSLRMLQVRSIKGDTGVAIVLYPGPRMQPGEYPVRPPEEADSVSPPAAALAARWLSATAVQGFQAESGVVTLTRAPDGSLDGRFHATGHGLPISLRLAIAGSFEGLREARAPRSCAGTPHADTMRAGPGDEAGDTSDGVD
ncbi:MAG: hypothetical protein ACTHM9_13305 [Gemmatimonadales bacterium]